MICNRLIPLVSSNYSALTCLRSQAARSLRIATLTQSTSRHSYSTETLQTPAQDGAPKVYAPKIENLVGEISNLTLLEVADLNSLLKERLNISDAPVMMAGGFAPAQGKSDEEEKDDEPELQKMYSVKLDGYDNAKKVELIKKFKTLMPDFNLVQAKKFIEGCPVIVRADMPKQEAEELLNSLKESGGDVSMA